MSLLFQRLFLIVALGFQATSAYKILVFSLGHGRSHVTFMGQLADELVEAGHSVTVLLQQLDSSINTNGTKLAKVILIPPHPWAAEIWSTVVKRKLANAWETTLDLSTVLQKSDLMAKTFATSCEQTLIHEDILEELKNEKFDLAITELFEACAVGIIEVLQIPSFIGACSSSLMDSVATSIGVPLFPSYVPSLASKSMDEMSYFERLVNFLFTEGSKYVFLNVISAEDKVFKRVYGDNFIDLQEKIAQAPFVLINMEPLLDFPRPITHKVIEIGGLSIPPAKPLNEYWEKVVTRRDRVIVMSFGTMAQSQYMPQAMKMTILETFSLFPDVTFIWKYEADDLQIPKNIKNVVQNKWLPQNDLLNHKNLMAFITHGGMNSIVETIFAGKPMIVVPVFLDQNRNANLVKKAGIGISLEIRDLNVMGKLRQAISSILNDNRFSEKARKLAKMIANKPVSAKTQLLRHVEFAAEFGPLPNLDPIGRTMPFYSYFLLDIFIPFSIFIVLFISFIIFVLYRVILRLLKGVRKVKTS